MPSDTPHPTTQPEGADELRNKLSMIVFDAPYKNLNVWALKQMDAILTAVTHERERAVLEQRLVELDLFEQFLNQRSTRSISRRSLYEFKMQRLEDLTKRLDELKGDA